MKKLIFITVTLLITVPCLSQVTTRIVGDSTKLYQTGGGNNELIIENSTRSLDSAFLQNLRNGRTRFAFAIDSAYYESGVLKLRRGGSIISFPILAPSDTVSTLATQYDLTQLDLAASLSSLGSGFDLAVEGTSSVKSLSASNGITADSATEGTVGVKLGGRYRHGDTVPYVDNPRLISVMNRLALNSPRSNILIANRQHIDSLFQDPVFDSIQGGTYGGAAFGVGRAFREEWGDTLQLQYGGALAVMEKMVFDSASTRFAAGNKDIWFSNGSMSLTNQYFPPRDSARVRVSPDGAAASNIRAALDIGGSWGYDLNVYHPGYGYTFPLANIYSVIDLQRENSATAQRNKQMTGAGVAGFVASWKNYQQSIGPGATDLGWYVSKIGDYMSYGTTRFNNAVGGATKEKILGVSTVDTVYGFWSEPKWTVGNEVLNGYGFVSRGDSDFNYMQGFLRLGENLPRRTADDRPIAKFENYGTTYLSDTITHAQSLTTTDTTGLYIAVKERESGIIKYMLPEDVMTGSSSTPGIDDVLAEAQQLSATRTIDANSNILNITNTIGFQVTNTQDGYLNIQNSGFDTKIENSGGDVTEQIQGNLSRIRIRHTYSGGTSEVLIGEDITINADDSLYISNLPTLSDTTGWDILARNRSSNAIAKIPSDLIGGGGGSSISFGTDNQIPYMNSDGDDFDYSANLTFDGNMMTVANSNAASTTNYTMTIEGQEGNDAAMLRLKGSGNRSAYLGLGLNDHMILKNNHPTNAGAGFEFRNRTSATVASFTNTVAHLPFAVTVNEAGGDFDFRVESDNDTHAIFSDASADKVGIGTSTLSEKLTVNGNVAASGGKVGVSLSNNVTSDSNAGTGEENLITYSLAAGKLATNGDYIEVTAAFLVTSVSNKIIIKFGSTKVVEWTTGNTGTYLVRGTITRTGAATQEAQFTVIGEDSGVAITSPTETLSGAITIAGASDASGAGGVTQYNLNVKYYPAN